MTVIAVTMTGWMNWLEGKCRFQGDVVAKSRRATILIAGCLPVMLKSMRIAKAARAMENIVSLYAA